VAETALFIGCQGTELPAILTRPAKPCRAAVILLHPADDPSRRQFLFEHLAGVLPELGIAVLRYDRRARAGDRDVPYLLQVEDLNRARDVLARQNGMVPTGVWGFSQGAWVALLAAAADHAAAFLVLVGCSAVSPARQMQYGTAGQLRRTGFGSEAIAELGVLRAAYEDYQRGALTRTFPVRRGGASAG
jgi:pimeloyl-ACP methyl ester carboxylesterase